MPLVNANKLNDYTPTTQNKIRKDNKNLIIMALSTPKRFKDLNNDLEISHTTISSLLQELLSDDEIKQDFKNNKPVYRLTKKGEKTFDDFCNLANDVSIIMDRNGKHFRDYSNLHNSAISKALPWGIESDLTLDQRLYKSNLLEKKDVDDIERLVYKKLVKNIKKNKSDKKQIGNIVLGFKIDYLELVQSIKKNSLTYMESITKEELKLLEKIHKDGANVTHDEHKRWQELRKETHTKIKNAGKGKK